MLDKTINLVDKLINIVMVVFFLLLILIGGYAFFDSYRIYDAVNLDAEIINLKPKKEEGYDFSGLKEINSDVEGWITIFETTIDFPVLKSKDNLEYLNLDYKRNYTAGGSIFTDYRNAPNFKDDYTIIYGHNMMTGQMFSDIKKFEKPEYFSQHLYGVLYTTDETYKLEVMYLAKINAYEDDVFNLITYANGRNLELAELVKNKAREANIVDGFDKLLLLSTCDSYGSNDRTVLLARLIPSHEGEISDIAKQVKENVTVVSGDGFEDRIGLPFRFGDLWWILLVIVLVVVLLRVISVRFWRSKKERKSND